MRKRALKAALGGLVLVLPMTVTLGAGTAQAQQSRLAHAEYSVKAEGTGTATARCAKGDVVLHGGGSVTGGGDPGALAASQHEPNETADEGPGWTVVADDSADDVTAYVRCRDTSHGHGKHGGPGYGGHGHGHGGHGHGPGYVPDWCEWEQWCKPAHGHGHGGPPPLVIG